MDKYTDPNATFSLHLRESASGLLSHLRSWFDAGYAPNDWNVDTLGEFWDWLFVHADEFHYTDGWSTVSRVFDAVKSDGVDR